MSAAPQTTSIAPVSDGGGCSPQEWIDLDEAARRSGWVKGHIKRMCGDVKRAPGGVTLQSKGLAKIVPSPNGGMPTWMVSANADPRFARVKFAEQLSAEWQREKATLHVSQRQVIDQRKAFLHRWEQQLKTGAVVGAAAKKVTTTFCEQLAAEGFKVCPATLYNWRAAYRRDGEAGLLDARAVAQRKRQDQRGQADDPFFDFIRRIYLTPRRLSLQYCHDLAIEAAIQNGWQKQSFRQCRRMIDALPPQLVVKMREGEDAFVLKCEPAIEIDYTTLASNDIWCADDHRFDVAVEVGRDEKNKPIFRRPFLCGFEDLRSRMIVGWSIIVHDPNAETVLQTFQGAVTSHGLPRQVLIDNGKHYDSLPVGGLTKRQRRSSRGEAAPDAFFGAFPGLSVGVRHAKPYHGQSKPIERTFGTVCSRFSKLWETYVGGTTATKPEDLAKQIGAGKAPTLAEFTATFAEWVQADYHDRLHSGNGMNDTPAAVYDANLVEKRPVEPSILAYWCAPTYCPMKRRRDGSIERGVKVTKQGVEYKGLRFGAFDAQVQSRWGQRVAIKPMPNLSDGVILVSIDGGGLLCKAPPNLRLGHDARPEDVRAAQAEKGKLRKTFAAYQQARPRMSHDLHQLTIDAGRRRRAAQTPPPVEQGGPIPPTVKLVRTAVDDQLPAIQRALQTNKKAVGAENLDLDQFRPRMPAINPQREVAGAGDAGEDDIDVFAAVSAAMQRRGES